MKTSSLRCFLGLLIAASSVFFLLGGAPSGNPLALVDLTSVQVLTDRLVPREGAIVQWNDGTTTRVLVTDGNGQTPWADLPTGPVELTLVEQATGAGTALGLVASIDPPLPPSPGPDFHLNFISRTQPLAVPVFVQGNPHDTHNIFPPSGDHPHWTVVVPQYSTLRFAMEIASILDHDAIEEYLEYRGTPAGSGLHYVRGVAMVVPAVQLGDPGLVIGIELLGDLPQGAVVDAYNFTTSPHVMPPGPPLGVVIAGTIADTIYVRITGRVGKGQLALFARAADGAPGNVHVTADAPPTIAVPPDAGEGVEWVRAWPERSEESAAVAMVQDWSWNPMPSPWATDCEPPVPGRGDWSCTPAPPAANHCGPPAAGSSECKLIRMRTPKFCRSAGSTVTGSSGKTSEWKVTFQFETGGDKQPIQSAGGFTYGASGQTTTTETWTAAPGAHGLGQCMRYFRFELVCAQPFTLSADSRRCDEYGTVVTDPCATTTTRRVVCTDTNISQSVCDRTP